jgi:ABC-2 type transport system permease protein
MIVQLTKTFLRIFFRDRRAIIFSLFFPLVFMAIFSFTGNLGPQTVSIGIADNANNIFSTSFKQALTANDVFELSEASEAELRAQVTQGDLQLALLIPAGFSDNGTPAELPVIVKPSV